MSTYAKICTETHIHTQCTLYTITHSHIVMDRIGMAVGGMTFKIKHGFKDAPPKRVFDLTWAHSDAQLTGRLKKGLSNMTFLASGGALPISSHEKAMTFDISFS